MISLIRIDGDEAGNRIDLKAGSTTIGSSDAADICLDEDSISNFHCRIRIGDEGAEVEDLQSLTGTYLDEIPVSHPPAPLHAGQHLQVGTARFKVHSDTTPPAPDGALDATAKYCRKCSVWVTESEAKNRRVGREWLPFCPHCGSLLRADAEREAPVEAPARSGAFSDLADMFVYPLRGDGAIKLLAGAICLVLLKGALALAQMVIIYGILLVLMLGIVVVGYLMEFFKSIAARSAHGDDEVPEWPVVENVGSDIISPMFQCLGLAAFCFAPVAVGEIWGEPAWLGWVLLGFGVLYLPMGFLAVALLDTLAGLNPVLIVSSIRRIWPRYLVTCAFLILIHIVIMNLGRLITMLPVPILPAFVSGWLFLYAGTASARLLGTLYYQNHQQLRWF